MLRLTSYVFQLTANGERRGQLRGAMKKAIIVGASSGIGMELAKVLAAKDYIVGLAARRLEILSELQKELPAKSYTKRIDISQPAEAMSALGELINDMSGVDTMVICSGISIDNPGLDWDSEIMTLTVNVIGVTAMVNVAYNYFSEQGGGHIVGISSFKALRGGGKSPAYNASKAFLSNYLEGLRIKSNRLGNNIFVTDIRPGLVDTSMSGGGGRLFVAPVKKVAAQICRAMENKENIAYIPRRYSLIGCLMRNMPCCLYSKFKR